MSLLLTKTFNSTLSASSAVVEEEDHAIASTVLRCWSITDATLRETCVVTLSSWQCLRVQLTAAAAAAAAGPDDAAPHSGRDYGLEWEVSLFRLAEGQAAADGNEAIICQHKIQVEGVAAPPPSTSSGLSGVLLLSSRELLLHLGGTGATASQEHGDQADSSKSAHALDYIYFDESTQQWTRQARAVVLPWRQPSASEALPSQANGERTVELLHVSAPVRSGGEETTKVLYALALSVAAGAAAATADGEHFGLVVGVLSVQRGTADSGRPLLRSTLQHFFCEPNTPFPSLTLPRHTKSGATRELRRPSAVAVTPSMCQWLFAPSAPAVAPCEDAVRGRLFCLLPRATHKQLFQLPHLHCVGPQAGSDSTTTVGLSFTTVRPAVLASAASDGGWQQPTAKGAAEENDELEVERGELADDGANLEDILRSFASDTVEVYMLSVGRPLSTVRQYVADDGHTAASPLLLECVLDFTAAPAATMPNGLYVHATSYGEVERMKRKHRMLHSSAAADRPLVHRINPLDTVWHELEPISLHHSNTTTITASGARGHTAVASSPLTELLTRARIESRQSATLRDSSCFTLLPPTPCPSFTAVQQQQQKEVLDGSRWFVCCAALRNTLGTEWQFVYHLCGAAAAAAAAASLEERVSSLGVAAPSQPQQQPPPTSRVGAATPDDDASFLEYLVATYMAQFDAVARSGHLLHPQRGETADPKSELAETTAKTLWSFSLLQLQQGGAPSSGINYLLQCLHEADYGPDLESFTQHVWGRCRSQLPAEELEHVLDFAVYARSLFLRFVVQLDWLLGPAAAASESKPRPETADPLVESPLYYFVLRLLGGGFSDSGQNTSNERGEEQQAESSHDDGCGGFTAVERTSLQVLLQLSTYAEGEDSTAGAAASQQWQWLRRMLLAYVTKKDTMPLELLLEDIVALSFPSSLLDGRGEGSQRVESREGRQQLMAYTLLRVVDEPLFTFAVQQLGSATSILSPADLFHLCCGWDESTLETACPPALFHLFYFLEVAYRAPHTSGGVLEMLEEVKHRWEALLPEPEEEEEEEEAPEASGRQQAKEKEERVCLPLPERLREGLDGMTLIHYPWCAMPACLLLHAWRVLLSGGSGRQPATSAAVAQGAHVLLYLSGEDADAAEDLLLGWHAEGRREADGLTLAHFATLLHLKPNLYLSGDYFRGEEGNRTSQRLVRLARLLHRVWAVKESRGLQACLCGRVPSPLAHPYGTDAHRPAPPRWRLAAVVWEHVLTASEHAGTNGNLTKKCMDAILAFQQQQAQAGGDTDQSTSCEVALAMLRPLFMFIYPALLRNIATLPPATVQVPLFPQFNAPLTQDDQLIPGARRSAPHVKLSSLGEVGEELRRQMHGLFLKWLEREESSDRSSLTMSCLQALFRLVLSPADIVEKVEKAAQRAARQQAGEILSEEDADGSRNALADFLEEHEDRSFQLSCPTAFFVASFVPVQGKAKFLIMMEVIRRELRHYVVERALVKGVLVMARKTVPVDTKDTDGASQLARADKEGQKEQRATATTERVSLERGGRPFVVKTFINEAADGLEPLLEALKNYSECVFIDKALNLVLLDVMEYLFLSSNPQEGGGDDAEMCASAFPKETVMQLRSTFERVAKNLYEKELNAEEQSYVARVLRPSFYSYVGLSATHMAAASNIAQEEAHAKAIVPYRESKMHEKVQHHIVPAVMKRARQTELLPADNALAAALHDFWTSSSPSSSSLSVSTTGPGDSKHTLLAEVLAAPHNRKPSTSAPTKATVAPRTDVPTFGLLGNTLISTLGSTVAPQPARAPPAAEASSSSLVHRADDSTDEDAQHLHNSIALLVKEESFKRRQLTGQLQLDLSTYVHSEPFTTALADLYIALRVEAKRRQMKTFAEEQKDIIFTFESMMNEKLHVEMKRSARIKAVEIAERCREAFDQFAHREREERIAICDARNIQWKILYTTFAEENELWQDEQLARQRVHLEEQRERDELAEEAAQRHRQMEMIFFDGPQADEGNVLPSQAPQQPQQQLQPQRATASEERATERPQASAVRSDALSAAPAVPPRMPKEDEEEEEEMEAPLSFGLAAKFAQQVEGRSFLSFMQKVQSTVREAVAPMPNAQKGPAKERVASVREAADKDDWGWTEEEEKPQTPPQQPSQPLAAHPVAALPPDDGWDKWSDAEDTVAQPTLPVHDAGSEFPLVKKKKGLGGAVAAAAAATTAAAPPVTRKKTAPVDADDWAWDEEKPSPPPAAPTAEKGKEEAVHDDEWDKWSDDEAGHAVPVVPVAAPTLPPPPDADSDAPPIKKRKGLGGVTAVAAADLPVAETERAAAAPVVESREEPEPIAANDWEWAEDHQEAQPPQAQEEPVAAPPAALTAEKGKEEAVHDDEWDKWSDDEAGHAVPVVPVAAPTLPPPPDADSDAPPIKKRKGLGGVTAVAAADLPVAETERAAAAPVVESREEPEPIAANDWEWAEDHQEAQPPQAQEEPVAAPPAALTAEKGKEEAVHDDEWDKWSDDEAGHAVPVVPVAAPTLPPPPDADSDAPPIKKRKGLGGVTAVAAADLPVAETERAAAAPVVESREEPEPIAANDWEWAEDHQEAQPPQAQEEPVAAPPAALTAEKGKEEAVHDDEWDKWSDDEAGHAVPVVPVAAPTLPPPPDADSDAPPIKKRKGLGGVTAVAAADLPVAETERAAAAPVVESREEPEPIAANDWEWAEDHQEAQPPQAQEEPVAAPPAAPAPREAPHDDEWDKWSDDEAGHAVPVVPVAAPTLPPPDIVKDMPVAKKKGLGGAVAAAAETLFAAPSDGNKEPEPFTVKSTPAAAASDDWAQDAKKTFPPPPAAHSVQEVGKQAAVHDDNWDEWSEDEAPAVQPAPPAATGSNPLLPAKKKGFGGVMAALAKDLLDVVAPPPPCGNKAPAALPVAPTAPAEVRHEGNEQGPDAAEDWDWDEGRQSHQQQQPETPPAAPEAPQDDGWDHWSDDEGHAAAAAAVMPPLPTAPPQASVAAGGEKPPLVKKRKGLGGALVAPVADAVTPVSARHAPAGLHLPTPPAGPEAARSIYSAFKEAAEEKEKEEEERANAERQAELAQNLLHEEAAGRHVLERAESAAQAGLEQAFLLVL